MNGYDAVNPDLGRRNPENRTADAPDLIPPPLGSDAALAGAINFDRVDRVSYAAPPTTGLLLQLFQVTDDVTRGLITGIGIACPQFDWFGTNEYYFAINQAPPMEYQLSGSGGPQGGTQTTFPFIPVGTLQVPKSTRINIKGADRFMIGIRAQTTPAAGLVVYNLVVRTTGLLWR